MKVFGTGQGKAGGMPGEHLFRMTGAGEGKSWRQQAFGEVSETRKRLCCSMPLLTLMTFGCGAKASAMVLPMAREYWVGTAQIRWLHCPSSLASAVMAKSAGMR